MRWIFWFLLLSNGVLAIWNLAGQKPLDTPPSPAESTAQATVDASVKSLRLVSEMAAEDLQARSRDEAPPAAPQLCLMAGAFADVAAAEQFIARLAALDVAAFVHPVDLTAGEGFWVFLEPFGNREAARRRLAELQARGVDSYIIPKGELENGISLGVFTRLELAEARLAELAKLGLDAKMQNIERSYRETWVMLGAGEENKLGEEVWQQLLQENLALQQRQNFCSDVASAKNFH